MKKILIFIVFIGCIAPVRESSAQWKMVAPKLLNNVPIPYGGAIYFKDGLLWAGFSEVFVSRDTGKTWQKTSGFSQPVTGYGGQVFDISFFDKNIGAITTSIGIYLTHNGGKSWDFSYKTTAYQISFGRSKDDIFAYSTSGWAQRTTNGGATWESVLVNNYSNFCVGFTIQKNGEIFTLDQEPSMFDPVHVSTDNGLTWKPTPVPLPVGTCRYYYAYSIGGDSCNERGLYVPFQIDTQVTDSTFTSSSNIYYSPDGGASWNLVFTYHDPYPYLNLAFSSGPTSHFAQTTRDGILRSTDHGATWKNIGGPGNVQHSRSLCAIDNNIILAFDKNGNIWETRNSGGDSVLSSRCDSSFEIRSGVSDLPLALSDFSIFPNPASTTLEVRLSNGGNTHYELFDALGINRKSGTTEENSFQIDLSDIAVGNYYLRVSTGNGVPVTKKIVVIK